MWSYRQHDPVADTNVLECDDESRCVSTIDVIDGIFVFHALTPIQIEATVKEFQHSTLLKKYNNKGRPTSFTKSRSVSFAINPQNSPTPVPFPTNSLIAVDRVVTFEARRRSKITNTTDPLYIGDLHSDSYESVEAESHRAVVSKEEDTNVLKYGRLSDSSGWIKIYELGTWYCNELAVESDLYSFHVDNIPIGLTCRFHPLDDHIDLLPSELANRNLLLHLDSLTKIYCDLKVKHPTTGVCFYRLQMSALSCIPLWVHDKQTGEDPESDPDIYKLLPSEKIVDGTIPDKNGLLKLFAYQVVQGALVRSKPDCTEESKDFSCIVQKNDILVGNLIRESPLPQNGNGPFIRLTTPNVENLNKYWLFEKKQHAQVLKPVPIKCGRWEFQVALNPSIVDSANEDIMMCRAGVFVYTQPLDRCLSTSESTIAFFRVGDFIQCDYKIEQTVTEEDIDDADDEDDVTMENSHSQTCNNSKRTKTNYYYRTMLSDGRYGWVSELDLSDVVQNFRRFRQHQQLQQQYAAKLRLLTSQEQEDPSSYLEEFVFSQSDNTDWTIDDVRQVAAHAGVKEIAYQPVGNVLIFETVDFVQVAVFCLTKTVQTSYQHAIDNQEDNTIRKQRDIERSFSLDSEYGADGEGQCNGRSQVSYHHNDAKFYMCHRKCCSLVDLLKVMKMSMLQMITMTNTAQNFHGEKTDDNRQETILYENYCEEKKDDTMPIEGLNSTYHIMSNSRDLSVSSCSTIFPFDRRKDGPRLVHCEEYEIAKRRELMEYDARIHLFLNRRMQIMEELKPIDEWRTTGNTDLSQLFAKLPVPSASTLQQARNDTIIQQVDICARKTDRTIYDDKAANELSIERSSSLLLDEGFEIINNKSFLVTPSNMIPEYNTAHRSEYNHSFPNENEQIDSHMLCEMKPEIGECNDSEQKVAAVVQQNVANRSIIVTPSDVITPHNAAQHNGFNYSIRNEKEEIDPHSSPVMFTAMEECNDCEQNVCQDVEQKVAQVIQQYGSQENKRNSSEVIIQNSTRDIEKNVTQYVEQNVSEDVTQNIRQEIEKTMAEHTEQKVTNEIDILLNSKIEVEPCATPPNECHVAVHNESREIDFPIDELTGHMDIATCHSLTNAQVDVAGIETPSQGNNAGCNCPVDNSDEGACSGTSAVDINHEEATEDKDTTSQQKVDNADILVTIASIENKDNNGHATSVYDGKDISQNIVSTASSEDFKTTDDHKPAHASAKLPILKKKENQDDSESPGDIACTDDKEPAEASTAEIEYNQDNSGSSCVSITPVDVEEGDVEETESVGNVSNDSGSSNGEMTRLISIAVSPSSSTTSHIVTLSETSGGTTKNPVETGTASTGHQALPGDATSAAAIPSHTNHTNSNSMMVIKSTPPKVIKSTPPKHPPGRMVHASILTINSSHSQCRTLDTISIDGRKNIREQSSNHTSPTEFVRTPSTATTRTSCSGMGSRRRGLVCGECFQMFSGKYSRDIHCREVHKLYCRSCGKIFPSTLELNSHRC